MNDLIIVYLLPSETGGVFASGPAYEVGIDTTLICAARTSR
jgi:hypothetical protein